ncbi:MAG: DUF3365 domain-containing protein [Nitrospirae bacterium]|nr:DUF3365 domain-containing protein [Nitrospirota bacterium]
MSGLLYSDQVNHKRQMQELAKGEAASAFEKDLIYRRWNTSHGGVYVPVTQNTPPNPHLANIPERDLTTTTGKKLTLMNPAYMTRQAHEIAARENGVLGHITSLNPIRPENEADSWEKAALQDFERGTTEHSSEELINGRKYLRYMRPLKTEKACLKCHAVQGYKEGDVRGGISISLPMEPYLKVDMAVFRSRLATYGFLWLIGLVLIGTGAKQLIGQTTKIREQEKVKEEAIRNAKEEWERTFDAITDPIMILDTNFKIIKANKSTADRLGVSVKEAEGLTCYEAVHGTKQPPASCPHVKLISDGKFHAEEITESRLGGCFHVTVSPICSNDGTLYGSVHSARDITELKKAEELGRKHSKDLEKLLFISREVTLTSDIRGLYRIFVSAAKELLAFDFSSLMLLSDDKTVLTVADCLGFPETIIGNFSLVEGQGLSTYVVRTKQFGTVHDFQQETRFEVPSLVIELGIRSAVAVPMMVKDDIIGVLIGHTKRLREFSQREIDMFQHIANQAAIAVRNVMTTRMLMKSEKKIQDIASSLGEGLYSLDNEGYVTYMNPEAEKLLGWTMQELCDRNIHDVVHNCSSDGTPLSFKECPIHKVISTGRRFISSDEIFIRKDGASFPVSIISAPLMEEGMVVASITAFRDISERKQIEKERETLIDELQKALAEIRTLQGILPICSYCKKIRDDKGAWTQMELYISKRTDAQFSHGICSECARKEFPQFFKEPGSQDDSPSAQRA